jgi:chromosome segregation ATPase
MNRLEVLKREAEGMQAAIDEINSKIGAAEAQRESIAILLDAIESAVRGIEAEPEQLELPFTDDNVIAFPAHGSN